MKNKTKDLKITKKRMLIVFAVFAAVVVVTSVLLYGSRKRTKKPTVKPVEVVAPATDIMKQKWLIKSQAQLVKQTQQIAMLQSKLKVLSKENVNLQKEMQKRGQLKSSLPAEQKHHVYNQVDYPPPPPQLPSNPYQSGKAFYRSRQYGSPTGGRTRTGFKTKQTKQGRSYQTTQRPLNNLIASALPSSNQTNNTKPELNQTNGVLNQTLKTQTKQPNTHRRHLLIPPGSFVSAFMLTGADVPTMGNGSVGPIPIVFRVMSLAQMPNYFKTNIKSCFLLGQATGSLSAERAYVRVSTLSCVKKDGTPLVVHVQGYAAGADGKAGLKGRVVSKQGSVLARALVAGFLQGVGEAFSQTQSTISVSPLGTTNSIAPNASTIVKYGVGNGVGKATEMLAKFYMKMANQMFPVIEINAGRLADVIFLKGVKLSGGER